MSDIQLSTFPDSKTAALAMLYVQNQDLSGKTPKDILDMYDDAYEEIRQHMKKKPKPKIQNISY